MPLRAVDSLLLVVDIQERLAAAMADAERGRVERATGLLTSSAGLLGVPVVVSEQYPKGIGHTTAAVRERTPAGAAFHEKTAFSCCGDRELQGVFARSGRGQIVVVGMETHVCILQTALDLHAGGYDVHVAADAVCSRAPGNRDAALDRMRQAGITVTCAESVVFEWLRDAAHPQFRAVSALVKERGLIP